MAVTPVLRQLSELLALFEHKDVPTEQQWGDWVGSCALKLNAAQHALAHGFLLDLSIEDTNTVVYTVPTPAKCIFTGVILRDISASTTAGPIEVRTLAAGDLISSISLASLGTDQVLWAEPVKAPSVYVPVKNGDTIALRIATGNGQASRTVRVDVLGYLLPTSE